jgi:phosphomannomutase
LAAIVGYVGGRCQATVTDVPAAVERLRTAFAGRGNFDTLDGLTVSGGNQSVDSVPPRPDETRDFWWFNVRPSNTEPLLRLNVEGGSRDVMESVRDEALAIIRQS